MSQTPPSRTSTPQTHFTTVTPLECSFQFRNLWTTSVNVPASTMTALGHGVANPVAPNTTAAGRAQNRRVEIKRLQ